MGDILRAIGEGLRAAALWELNGWLALLYTAGGHVLALLTAAAYAALLWLTPPGRRHASPARDQLSGQRPWLLAVVCMFASCWKAVRRVGLNPCKSGVLRLWLRRAARCVIPRLPRMRPKVIGRAIALSTPSMG